MDELKNEVVAKEETEKLLNKIKEEGSLSEMIESIKDNKLVFTHNEITYRVRLLNFKEKHELSEMKLKKFGQMMNDPNCLTEKQLIKKYKEQKDIDIDKIYNDELKKLDAQILNFRISQGESISKNENKAIIETYDEQIAPLLKERQVLEYQKMAMLHMSFESQILSYEAEIITFLTLEVLNEEKWQRMFNTYEEFLSYEDEDLLNLAGMKSMLLQNI